MTSATIATTGPDGDDDPIVAGGGEWSTAAL